MGKFQEWYRQVENLSASLPKQFVPQKREVDLKLSKYQLLLAERVCLLGQIDMFYKRCIVLAETTVLK